MYACSRPMAALTICKDSEQTHNVKIKNPLRRFSECKICVLCIWCKSRVNNQLMLNMSMINPMRIEYFASPCQWLWNFVLWLRWPLAVVEARYSLCLQIVSFIHRNFLPKTGSQGPFGDITDWNAQNDISITLIMQIIAKNML